MTEEPTARRSAEQAALDRLRSTGPGAKKRARGADQPQWAGRDPITVGNALDKLITERGWDGEVRDAEVVARFAEVVGADIAGHAKPSSFDEATLVIQAVDSVWATQLRFLTPQLLARFAEVLGPDVVKTIEVLGPRAPRRGRRRFTVR
ncbi:MAG: DUF721 domain-containing protein [Bifidobacteriaceae bacterium]|nr:DUF721 domain-containing protein [Bifidobacteriaceae bacterium]